MLQRVGIAQALINDPEVVFLDEPMSGLDPIGRRDVRALILRLRDEGRTVFFSSHILSDAETLCSRVAVLAKGRLVASGALSEMLAFRAQGWEAVVEGLPEMARQTAFLRFRAASPRIGQGRAALEFGPERGCRRRSRRPIALAGAALVSVKPLRESLEDFFIQQVAGAGLGADGGAGRPDVMSRECL